MVREHVSPLCRIDGATLWLSVPNGHRRCALLSTRYGFVIACRVEPSVGATGVSQKLPKSSG